jgi:hypothetical protein
MSSWQMSDWKELPTCCDAQRCGLKRLLIVWAMARSRVSAGRLRRDSIRARQSIAGSSASLQRSADLGDRVRLTDLYSSIHRTCVKANTSCSMSRGKRAQTLLFTKPTARCGEISRLFWTGSPRWHRNPTMMSNDNSEKTAGQSRLGPQVQSG